MKKEEDKMIIVIEYFNSNLFHPANKQHIYQSIKPKMHLSVKELTVKKKKPSGFPYVEMYWNKVSRI